MFRGYEIFQMLRAEPLCIHFTDYEIRKAIYESRSGRWYYFYRDRRDYIHAYVNNVDVYYMAPISRSGSLQCSTRLYARHQVREIFNEFLRPRVREKIEEAKRQVHLAASELQGLKRESNNAEHV